MRSRLFGSDGDHLHYVDSDLVRIVGDEVTLAPVLVAKRQLDGKATRLRAPVDGVDVLDLDRDQDAAGRRLNTGGTDWWSLATSPSCAAGVVDESSCTYQSASKAIRMPSRSA